MESPATRREFRTGQRLARLGVMVACEPAQRGPIRGLAVRAWGSAIERGVVAVERARARPFSARLAPWEGAGWEHSLAVEGAGAVCVLRAARVGGEGQGHRGALPGAVYVELVGRASCEGDGELGLSVEPIAPGAAGVASAAFRVCVRAQASREVLSAYAAWPGPLAGERARAVERTIARFARVVGSLPAGPRALSARGTAVERLALREGCVVLGGRRALSGDARWDALLERLRAGALEQLALVTPGPLVCADRVLELALVDRGRFVPGPVELVLSLGRSRLPAEPRSRNRVVRGLVRAVELSGAVHGFVAEHGWVPSLLEHTPWELSAGVEPARTVEALERTGRVDSSRAVSVVGAGALRERGI